MLCDAAMVVTIMMNGACCIWQEHNEQKRRNAIRTDIRAEYWHHKIMEQELYQAQQQEMMMMSVQDYGEMYESDSGDIIRRQNHMMNGSDDSITSRKSQRTNCTAPTRMSTSPQSFDSNPIVSSRTWPNDSHRRYSKRQYSRTTIERAQNISLLDSDDNDEDENEDDSMVSIPLNV